jgi:hypothetical protein
VTPKQSLINGFDLRESTDKSVFAIQVVEMFLKKSIHFDGVAAGPVPNFPPDGRVNPTHEMHFSIAIAALAGRVRLACG